MQRCKHKYQLKLRSIVAFALDRRMRKEFYITSKMTCPPKYEVINVTICPRCKKVLKISFGF